MQQKIFPSSPKTFTSEATLLLFALFSFDSVFFVAANRGFVGNLPAFVGSFSAGTEYLAALGHETEKRLLRKNLQPSGLPDRFAPAVLDRPFWQLLLFQQH